MTLRIRTVMLSFLSHLCYNAAVFFRNGLRPTVDFFCLLVLRTNS